MKNNGRYFLTGSLLLSLLLLQGCDLVIDIFSVGFWVGVGIAVLIVVLIIWLFVKVFKRFGR